jgi:hypothetical protein
MRWYYLAEPLIDYSGCLSKTSCERAERPSESGQSGLSKGLEEPNTYYILHSDTLANATRSFVTGPIW